MLVRILFHAAVLLYTIYNVYAVLILRDSILGCWTQWDWEHCLPHLCNCPQSKMNRCRSVQFELFQADTHQCRYSWCHNSGGRTQTVAHTPSHQRNRPGHRRSHMNSILFLPSSQLAHRGSNHHISPPTYIVKDTHVYANRISCNRDVCCWKTDSKSSQWNGVLSSRKFVTSGCMHELINDP